MDTSLTGQWDLLIFDKRYYQITTSQYKPQLLSRTSYLDWEKLLKDVKQEAARFREELEELDKSIPASTALRKEVSWRDTASIQLREPNIP